MNGSFRFFKQTSLLCALVSTLQAQAPQLNSVVTQNGGQPGVYVPSTGGPVTVPIKITGVNLKPAKGGALQFPFATDKVQVNSPKFDDLGSKVTATLIIQPGTPTIKVSINNGVANSNWLPFLTGIVAGGEDTNCSTGDDPTLPLCRTLRWEIDSNAATATNGDTNTQTTPDVLFKLDYQVKSVTAGTKIPNTNRYLLDIRDPHQTLGDSFSAHLIFRTGITQAIVANTLQTLASAGSACSGSGTAKCMKTIIAQQAFLAEGSATAGWSMGQKGNGGGFAELGLKARGAFQQLIARDHIVQSGGINYAALSQNNPQSWVGLYEGTLRLRIGQHDVNTYNPNTGSFSNSDDLLVIEAGYQNNSGLNHLNADSPQSSTRNRFVGRFLAYPEVDRKTHTKVLLGVEYNSGLFNGGLKDIRYFYGVNADILKLLKPDPKNQ